MADPTSAITNLLKSMDQAALDQKIIRASGAGKAYQSVAQSTAIAVQDSTDYLRNVSTISAVAYGVAMVLIVAGDDDKASSLIENANTIVSNAADQFKTIGTNAGDVLRGFPSG